MHSRYTGRLKQAAAVPEAPLCVVSERLGERLGEGEDVRLGMRMPDEVYRGFWVGSCPMMAINLHGEDKAGSYN